MKIYWSGLLSPLFVILGSLSFHATQMDFFFDGPLYIALILIQGKLEGSSELFAIIPRTAQYIESFDNLLKTTCQGFNQINSIKYIYLFGKDGI